MYIAAVLFCMVEDPNMCAYKTSPVFFTDMETCFSEVIRVAPTLLENPNEIFIAEIQCFEFEYEPPGSGT